MSKQLILSDNKTKFTTIINPPFEFKNPSEIALINLETYYSIPNVVEGNNNQIRLLKNPEKGAWEFSLPTGSYDLVGINKAFEKIFKDHDLYDKENDTYPFTFEANHNTFKTIMNVSKIFVVDFTQNSINKILGFNPVFYTDGIHTSERVINILNVNSILVNIDIISESYVKGRRTNTIYSFFPYVNPGHKIVERTPHPIYLPLLFNKINSITTIITDQDGNQIDLRGENITMRFHIKEILN